jgi:hypothetical protein
MNGISKNSCGNERKTKEKVNLMNTSTQVHGAKVMFNKVYVLWST